jgi:hypothetical protein
MSENLTFGDFMIFLVGVGYITTYITQLVIGTMGMVHSVPILQNGHKLKCTTVDSFEPDMMYIWLIVYGSLNWVHFLLYLSIRSISGPNTTDENGEKYDSLAGKTVKTVVVGLFRNFPENGIYVGWVGWGVYGIIQIFDQQVYNSLVGCDEYSAHLMTAACLVSLVLYCIAGIVCAFLILQEAYNKITDSNASIYYRRWDTTRTD